MADSMLMFAVTAGIFVFLMAVVFGARAKRYSSGKVNGIIDRHE